MPLMFKFVIFFVLHLVQSIKETSDDAKKTKTELPPTATEPKAKGSNELALKNLQKSYPLSSEEMKKELQNPIIVPIREETPGPMDHSVSNHPSHQHLDSHSRRPTKHHHHKDSHIHGSSLFSLGKDHHGNTLTHSDESSLHKTSFPRLAEHYKGLNRESSVYTRSSSQTLLGKNEMRLVYLVIWIMGGICCLCIVMAIILVAIAKQRSCDKDTADCNCKICSQKAPEKSGHKQGI